jgi:hypothetical protein
VQSYEHRSALRVGGCGAVIKRRILIPLPRLHHLKALQLQRAANLNHEIQDNFTFANTACASRAGVRSTMGRV